MTSKQAWSTRGRYLGQNSKPESSVARFACGVALAALFANIPVAVAQTVGPQQAAPTAAAPATASKPKVKAAAKAGPGVEGGGQAAAKKDPNEASNHVDNGIKLLQGGKIDAAVHTFSSVIGAGKLPPTTMARALYNRGLAYRKQGKQAQAISDLTSALWLKGGLNDAERADALASRVAAYREAGLSDQSTGDDSTAAADNKVSATRSKTADQVNKQLTTQSIGQSGTAPAIVAKAPTVAAAAALAPDTSAGSSSGRCRWPVRQFVRRQQYTGTPSTSSGSSDCRADYGLNGSCSSSCGSKGRARQTDHSGIGHSFDPGGCSTEGCRSEVPRADRTGPDPRRSRCCGEEGQGQVCRVARHQRVGDRSNDTR